MSDMVGSGLAWLKQQREAHMSVAVTYISDGSPLPTVVLATIGRQNFIYDGGNGIPVRLQYRDYLIGSDQLSVTPKRGDIIEQDGLQYEVVAPNNEPVWRWSDQYMNTYRIHTLAIGEAS